MVGRLLLNPFHLAGMVVKAHINTFDIRKVGCDVIGTNLDRAVLHIFGVGEFDFINQAEFLENNGTDKPIHVTARNQAVYLVGLRQHLRFACHKTKLLYLDSPTTTNIYSINC